jgi:hypothetical protein
MTDDLGSRVRQFRTELEKDRDYYLRLGRWNYRAAYIRAIIAVFSSAAAGILGLGFPVDHRLVALLALVPAIAVTVSSQFKWQQRANWHYRKHLVAKAQLRQLDYEILTPTAAQLAELSKGYSTIEAELNETWEDDLRLQVEAEEAIAEEAAEEGGDSAPSDADGRG